MVRSFWAKQDFDLRLKDYEGNCDLCWKKSLRKRLTLIKENPGIEQQWLEWEKEGEYVFDRDGLSITQIKEISTRSFFQVKDKFDTSKKQPQLFGIDLDSETKCTC